MDRRREAFSSGRQHGPWHHGDPDFDLLRDYPRFRDLVRPGG